MDPITELPPFKDGQELIDFFLEEQQDLTAIDRFSKLHDQGFVDKKSIYSELIPSTKPAENQQLSFEVDLDACTGCKACVTGCHSLNGLDDEETWRDVGLLLGLSKDEPYQQTITTACHHCTDPACLSGCPTLAYEKDPETGIVRHLDDQCIGCQYCVLKCPYDVPKYNESLGIVRKCDMCHQRLESNEAPACVQACPNKAIKIKIVDIEDINSRKDELSFLPNAPSPEYTKPSTIYKTTKIIPKIKSADYKKIKPEHSHLPLVFMLILTQASVGCYLFSGSFSLLNSSLWKFAFTFFGIFTLISIHVAILHLGRPLYAYRAVLGYKKSWLSREIIAFGVLAGMSTMLMTLPWINQLKEFGLPIPNLNMPQLIMMGNYSCAVVGILAIACSVMVYHDTKRSFWNWKSASLKFFGTMIILGSSISNLILLSYLTQDEFIKIAFVLNFLVGSVILIIKLKHESSLLSLCDQSNSVNHGSAVVTKEYFHQFFKIRHAMAFLGGMINLCVLASLFSGGGTNLIPLGAIALIFLFIGEFMERYLFFKTVIKLKMPGGI
ncbi:MAG: molybdopterin oxidoreductase [Planctomycetota bacterium]|nr:MAG: molybdopterin oxidoreductase [Planctomycetota bacterium]